MSDAIKHLNQQLEEFLETFQIPSVSVTVYRDPQRTASCDSPYQHFNAGFKDLEHGLCAGPDTMYAIGSCTKSFTAAAIGVLCDRGQLNLEDPVRKYIPEFEMYDPYAGAHLTIRDMLCHRCGLPRHEVSWYPRLDTYTEADMIRILRYLKPNAPFRYKMQYQNLMFTLAGFVIERVSGTTWENFLKENITDPLGLGYVAFDAPDLAAAKDPAVGYRLSDKSGRNEKVEYATLNTMKAAGSISLTSHQLAQWDAMFLHNGSYEGKQILSEEICREMCSPQMLISDPVIEPLRGFVEMQSYGLGLFTECYRGARILHHGGHIDGFIADQCFVPSHGLAFTVLTNSENAFGARAMRYTLLDRYLKLDPIDWIGRFHQFSQKRKGEAASQKRPDPQLSIQYPCPVSLDDIAGEYMDMGYGSITINACDGRLIIRMGTLTLNGVHVRAQHFLLTEEHVLPGELLEAEVEMDKDGNAAAFLIALESTSAEKIRFVRVKH